MPGTPGRLPFLARRPGMVPIAAGIDADPVLVRLQGFFSARRDDRPAALASGPARS
jgi:hypothetical protein